MLIRLHYRSRDQHTESGNPLDLHDLAGVVLSAFLGKGLQSLQFTSTQVLSYAEVKTEMMSTASSIASMAQQLSRGFGVAITAGILHMALTWQGESVVSLFDLQLAFAGAALLVFVSILFALPMPADAAAEVSGHKPRLARPARLRTRTRSGVSPCPVRCEFA